MKPEDSTQDELQRVLALKRHEQPPETFFKGLSEKVMDRLQNPEPPPEPTLMQRLGLDQDSKPVLICLLGLVVCGLLAFGLISSRGMKAPPPTTPDPLGPQPARGSGSGLEGAGPMAAPPVKQEQSGGGSEPVIIQSDPGRRLPPPPRPPAAPGNPADPAK